MKADCYTFEGLDFRPSETLISNYIQRVLLRSQLNELLHYFVTHPHQTLSKDEIFKAVWGERFVSDAALFKAIQELRAILNQLCPDITFISTVPKKGYRWEIPVETMGALPKLSEKVTEVDVKEELNHRNLIWVSGMVIVLVLLVFYFLFLQQEEPVKDRIRLAVLPISDLSQNENFSWIRYGLTDVLNQILAENSKIEVVNLESVFRVASQESDFSVLRNRLASGKGCNRILEAEVVFNDPSWQMNYTLWGLNEKILSGVSSGNHPMDVTRKTAQEIVQLFKGEPLRFEDLLSRDNHVNETYAKGCEIFQKEGAARARPYFEICVNSDPSFLWGQLRLGQCWLTTGEPEKFKKAVNHVIEVASNKSMNLLLAFALAERASVACDFGDCSKGVEDLNRAMDIYRAANHQIGIAKCKIIEAYREAIQNKDPAQILDKFIELNVLLENIGDQIGQAQVLVNIGAMRNELGDRDGAVEVLSQARVLAGTHRLEEVIRIIDNNLGEVLLNQGKFNEAIAILQKLKDENHELGELANESFNVLNLGKAFLFKGQASRAEQMFGEAFELANKVSNTINALEATCWRAFIQCANLDWPGAERLLHEAQDIKVEPSNETFYFFTLMQAWVDIQKGLTIGAVKKLDSIPEPYSKTSGIYWLVIAHLHCQKGDLQKAEDSLLQAKSILYPSWWDQTVANWYGAIKSSQKSQTKPILTPLILL